MTLFKFIGKSKQSWPWSSSLPQILGGLRWSPWSICDDQALTLPLRSPGPSGGGTGGILPTQGRWCPPQRGSQCTGEQGGGDTARNPGRPQGGGDDLRGSEGTGVGGRVWRVREKWEQSWRELEALEHPGLLRSLLWGPCSHGPASPALSPWFQGQQTRSTSQLTYGGWNSVSKNSHLSRTSEYDLIWE